MKKTERKQTNHKTYHGYAKKLAELLESFVMKLMIEGLVYYIGHWLMQK